MYDNNTMYQYNPNKIEEVCLIKGLSKEDLASGAGVTITTIWNIMKGNMPHLKSLISIVNFLKIKIDDVIEFNPDAVKPIKTAVETLNEINPNNE